jgi:large subunit ribosomal protein L14e
MFDIGRICIKTAGREAGKYCVVVNNLETGFVLVTGPKAVTKVKRRKCNITHLEPLQETVKIKADASDEEVIRAYEESSIFSKLNIPKPAVHADGHAAVEKPEAAAKKHSEAAKKKEKEGGKAGFKRDFPRKTKKAAE